MEGGKGERKGKGGREEREEKGKEGERDLAPPRKKNPGAATAVSLVRKHRLVSSLSPVKCPPPEKSILPANMFRQLLYVRTNTCNYKE